MPSLAFIPPLLPTLVETPPEGGDWAHEIKFDGYRTQIVIDDDGVRLFTRNGHDWTAKYRTLAAAARRLDATSAIIDGELVLNDAEGKPDFGRLRTAIGTSEHELVFMAFDLLHFNGHDLRGMALEERRDILADLVEPSHEPIRFSESLAGSGAAVFKAIDGMGLEGMVSKRLSSRYASGRSEAWLKIKCYAEDDFNVIGVQRERGKPAMALMADRQGQYVGAAFITFPKAIRERLWARVTAKAGGAPPKGLAAEKAEWIKPGLVARVRFLKGEERLRHATVKEVREE